MEHPVRPIAVTFLPRLLQPLLGRFPSLAGRLGFKEYIEITACIAPQRRVSLQDDGGSWSRGWRWAPPPRSKPESETVLPTPRFLRQPRSILANAGFYFNFSLFIPRFKGHAWTVLE